MEALEKKTVAEMLGGRQLFITGVTGFVGKVLLEKVMRDCQDVDKIYVLIRASDIEDHILRLGSLFKERAFDRIRNDCPKMFSKVEPVLGDVALDFCGINQEVIDKMRDNVSVVFHCAANVRFDETLRRSVAVNIEGVRNVAQVCHNLKKLEALVHVSTAYAFCNEEEIKEKIFPEKVTPDELMNLCKWMNDEELELVYENVRNGRPSTYHFTKAIAEHLLKAECVERDSIPACIVRPSIITAAWREPFPGWVDTNNGPSGLVAACGRGIVKSVHAHPDIIADFVPVDVVVNTILIAARNLLVERAMAKVSFTIVNCTSNNANPLTWGLVEKTCLPLLFKYPSMTLYRYPGGNFKDSSFSHRWSMIFDHMIPAYLIELASYVTLRPLKVVKVYRRINNVLNHLEYFTTNQFNFCCDNYFELVSGLNEIDTEVFYVDMGPLNWALYFQDYVRGVRKYLLKENDETIPEAIKRMNRIYYIALAFKVSASCCGAWIIYRERHLFSKILFKTSGMLDAATGLVQRSVGRYIKLR